MAPLFFTCPTTHRKAPTGIDTDVQSLRAAWKATLIVKCPHCARAVTHSPSRAGVDASTLQAGLLEHLPHVSSSQEQESETHQGKPHDTEYVPIVHRCPPLSRGATPWLGPTSSSATLKASTVRAPRTAAMRTTGRDLPSAPCAGANDRPEKAAAPVPRAATRPPRRQSA
jgi:hypothetical protein